MSVRTDQILEILEGVYSQFKNGMTLYDLTRLRKAEDRNVRKRWGHDSPNTVKDKYNRQLKPDIQNAEEFDREVLAYFSGKSDRLIKVLKAKERKGRTPYEVQKIEEFDKRIRNRFQTDKEILEPKDENSSVKPRDKNILTEPNKKNHLEGKNKILFVSRPERNSSAREACILLKGSKCKICGFDFEKKYGKIGKGFIHIHHVNPMADTEGQYSVNVEKDLEPVCPNCHAMLHKRNPPLTISELQKIID